MNDNPSIGRLISYIYRRNHSFITQEFAQLDISSGHLPFLLSLHHHDGISQEELSLIVGVDKTTTARAIKKLVTQGYVTRRHTEKDKRFYSLSLTTKGKNIIPFLERTTKKLNAVLSYGLTADEKQSVLHILAKMAHNVTNFNC